MSREVGGAISGTGESFDSRLWRWASLGPLAVGVVLPEFLRPFDADASMGAIVIAPPVVLGG